MKKRLSNFLGEWIENLLDGFVNGMDDINIFFSENVKKLLEEAGGPDMGMMYSGMGT